MITPFDLCESRVFVIVITVKISVIAANGRSGKVFVECALAAGHSVKAGVYGKNTLSQHANMEVVECDATSINDLKRLIEGQDVVVSLIGHVRQSSPKVQADAMRLLIPLMQAYKIERLVSLTGTGVRFPGDRITFFDRVMNLLINIIDPIRVEDGKEHVKLLQQSNLKWTVIRVLKLQHTSPAHFTLNSSGPTKMYVSRTDVAKAILQVIEEQSFIAQAPILSKPS